MVGEDGVGETYVYNYAERGRDSDPEFLEDSSPSGSVRRLVSGSSPHFPGSLLFGNRPEHHKRL